MDPSNQPTQANTPSTTPSSTPPKSKKGLVIGLIVGFLGLMLLGTIILVAVIALVFSGKKSETETNSTTGGSSVQTDKTSDFTSSIDGFSISYPDQPTTENDSLDVSGVNVPLRQYSHETSNGQVAYLVQVADYPAAEFDFTGNERETIKGSLEGIGSASNYTTISTNPGEDFLGYPAGSGEYTVKNGNRVYKVYAKNVLKGNKLYTVMTVGAEKSGSSSKLSYDEFLASFKLY